MKPAVSALTLTATLSFCALARAQALGKPMQLVLGAERLTGVFSDHVSSEGPVGFGGGMAEQTEEISQTTVAFLGITPGIGGQNQAQVTPSTTPRFGIDLFLIPGLSVGGSIIYVARSASRSVETAAPGMTVIEEEELDSASTFAFAPRVGYAFGLGPLTLWARAGVMHTVYNESGERPRPMNMTAEISNTTTITQLALEALLAISPVSNVALLVGPYADLPLSSSYAEEENGEDVTGEVADVSYLSFGLWAGVSAYF